MELVKSGVTDMEEKVIHLINHISLTHLIHFNNHTNLPGPSLHYLQIHELHLFANPAPGLFDKLVVKHLCPMPTC